MNLEIIDKWLDEEYGVSYTRLEELHDFVIEQDLKHQEKADKEINRLNNIIDELEDLITIKISRASNEEDYDIEIDDMIELKDKLNELKGDNK